MPTGSSPFKSAFIALIGRPNSGKSTLLNTLLGQNLSIVTTLPQTTQRNMRGILSGKDYQLVFIDTPGIHRGKHMLNKSMYHQSTNMFKDAGIDILCYLVDISRTFGREEDEIAEMVMRLKISVCIIFNKIDMCRSVDTAVSSFFSRYPKLAPLPNVSLSAISPDAKNAFLTLIKPLMPYGPHYYPDDDLTDSNMRFFAAEYIRKQIIELTSKEVPHASCVEILDYKEYEDHHSVTATIHVETQGQKGIVIGKKGMLIKTIQKRAARELQKLTGVPATITCHVKVTPKWRDNKRFLSSLGIETRNVTKKGI